MFELQIHCTYKKGKLYLITTYSYKF